MLGHGDERQRPDHRDRLHAVSNVPQVTARGDGQVAVDWSAAPEPLGPFITLTRQQWLGLITSIKRMGGG